MRLRPARWPAMLVDGRRPRRCTRTYWGSDRARVAVFTGEAWKAGLPHLSGEPPLASLAPPSLWREHGCASDSFLTQRSAREGALSLKSTRWPGHSCGVLGWPPGLVQLGNQSQRSTVIWAPLYGCAERMLSFSMYSV